MDTLLLMVGCGVGFVLAYHTYGKFLARKIFKLDEHASVPSKEMADGVDYVPSKKVMIFGHHFTSIAGTGPIVGPAIGVIWGWLPAILWVVFGSIFMGAVHDFGALVISLRNEGRSISDIAAKYINARVRFIFFVIVFLVLLIVIAIFGIVIATVFKIYSESVVAVWLEIPIAMVMGWFIYKKSGSVVWATIAAVAAMYGAVVLGAYLEHVRPGMFTIPTISHTFASGKEFVMPPTGSWTIILLAYAWVASTLPVNMLLQPRDYINAWQLFIMMALLVAGTIVAGLTGSVSIVAPAINRGENIPGMFPLMFVTIACGAISGFHSLVSSGTSPKQLSQEDHSLFIGYGSMLTEGALAVLVIICVTAGIGMGLGAEEGSAKWLEYYGSWMGGEKLGVKLTPVVEGAANLMGAIAIPKGLGYAIMGVFIASFAGTTLDTAVRIQRYVVSELGSAIKWRGLANRWTATTFAVLTAAVLAFSAGANGAGAMTLWPLFGSVNQLLAALSLLVITIYLRKKGGLKFLVALLPCVAMLAVTITAMVSNEMRFFDEMQRTGKNNWLIISIGGAVLLLAVWMTVETALVFVRPGQKEKA